MFTVNVVYCKRSLLQIQHFYKGRQLSHIMVHKKAPRREKPRRIDTAKILVFGFLSVIAVGAILLMTPAASADGTPTPWYDALFTAVSATCVTGLVSVDTALHWSVFGQVVILFMIQTGGLGFMTIAALLSGIMRRRMSPKESLLLAESLSVDTYSDLDSLARRIIGGTVFFEAVGAVVLAVRFVPLFGWRHGIYVSVFHSVSAFCNAGFDVLGDYSGAFGGMTPFYGDALVSLTLCALIIIGGIGFVVLDDIKAWITKRTRLSVYSRLMLISSAILIFGGAFLTALLEWNNADSIGAYTVGEKLLSSLFASVTLRTAGFSTVDFGTMTEPTQYFMMILMFIGGGAGSTAGGVKVVTFTTVILAIITTARGGDEVNVFHRRIPSADVKKALSVIVIQLAVTLAAAITLSSTCGTSMTAALFETFSASGTVGLSLGLTPMLPPAALMQNATLMFFGRVGILTVTYAISMKNASRSDVIRYADAHFPI